MNEQLIECHQWLEFEKLISKLSSEFVNIAAHEVDGKIHDGLSRLGTFLNVERCFLFQFNWEKTEFRISHLWEATGIEKDLVVRGVLVQEYFPWLANNLLSDRDVLIEDVEHLNELEASVEYEYCCRMGIQSFIVLPVKCVNAPLCAIGLDSMHTKRPWPTEIKSRLRLIGEIFANAIVRKHAEQELQRAHDEVKLLKEKLEGESAYLQEEIRLEHNFENIIGESKALKYVLYTVEQVALTDSPVIILGETGTGKELVARAIHQMSPRGKGTLIKVNCAALPAELFESELFGHHKGAFTGATTQQIGRFEIARGSTIFLDEIGEMPVHLQAKLLRVIESGEYERLGNPETLHSDARIIASTNRNLEEAVTEGTFREDLWYRLKVVPITMPPLRKRKDDIPLLVQWFLVQLSKKLGKLSTHVSKKSMQTLMEYDWPGNVRELKHVLERALITTKERNLKFDLPKTQADSTNHFQSYEEMERNYLLTVLKASHWKIQGPDSAASILNMHPNTLRSRMRKLKIKKPILK